MYDVLVSPRASDSVRILTDPGLFSGSRTSMERLTPNIKKMFLKLSKIRIQLIFFNPIFWPKTGCETLVFRDTNNRIKSPYDDLFTLKLATEEQAIVVSNDKYRDIPERYPQYADQIRNR